MSSDSRSGTVLSNFRLNGLPASPKGLTGTFSTTAIQTKRHDGTSIILSH